MKWNLGTDFEEEEEEEEEEEVGVCFRLRTFRLAEMGRDGKR